MDRYRLLMKLAAMRFKLAMLEERHRMVMVELARERALREHAESVSMVGAVTTFCQG